MNRYRIFCDMDGVLCNWDQAFIDVCPEHISVREYEAKYGKDSFWDILNAYGVEWWADMAWMPDGKFLWSYVGDKDTYILSSPAKKNSVEGKLIWLARNLGIVEFPCLDLQTWDGKTRVLFGKEKYLIAKSKNDILIDDTQKKIDEWNNAGGTGILHKSANNTIKQLMAIYES